MVAIVLEICLYHILSRSIFGVAHKKMNKRRRRRRRRRKKGRTEKETLNLLINGFPVEKTFC